MKLLGQLLERAALHSKGFCKGNWGTEWVQIILTRLCVWIHVGHVAGVAGGGQAEVVALLQRPKVVQVSAAAIVRELGAGKKEKH
jgi:hypothetical protein